MLGYEFPLISPNIQMRIETHLTSPSINRNKPRQAHNNWQLFPANPVVEPLRLLPNSSSVFSTKELKAGAAACIVLQH